MTQVTDQPSTHALPSREQGQSSHVENLERFVAFAFAGADIMVETDPDGTVTYADGAFRSKFGREPEAFIGHSVRELVAPGDHEVLETALSLLAERGRLPPLMIRMSNAQRTPLALAGRSLPTRDLRPRLCLSFARPPAPLASMLRAPGTPHGFARAAEARLRAGIPCELGLIEISGDAGAVMSSSEAIGHAMEAAVPDAIGSEIAPGRFGLLGPPGAEADLVSITNLLEAALRKQGVEVSVVTRHLPLDSNELTPIQTARALRQALNVFAREGEGGLDKAGFDGGLAGYVRRATTQSASLRQAIRGTQFKLMFQPISSLNDQVPHHFEALIRPKPIKDCLFHGPQDFVMAVEAVGLADELDLAVARVACEAAERAGVSVAFNLSGQSVQSAGFRDRLVGLLKDSSARRAGLIIVEMTETAEIEDVAAVDATADALRSLNIPFCLDDFGAGAADIRLLRALNPDIVKLDGSYIPGIAEGGREHAFVAGMVAVARASKADIVAERVETQVEADALKLLGVQFGQGWLFGPAGPLPSSRPPSHGGGSFASSLRRSDAPLERLVVR
jgi:EAL domain-containing protein (putative c-di-GMP-specific phosphodiesterase class I)